MNKLEWANFYKSIGWHNIPIKNGTKKAQVDWEYWKDNLPSKKELDGWFKVNDFDLAVICGQSGIAVIDDDSYKIDGGQIKLASTLYQTTPRGGKHWLFKCPPGLRPSVNGKLAVDIRGFDSYILVAPSEGYKWNVGSKEEFLKALKDLPELPLKYLEKVQPKKAPGEKFDWSKLEGMAEGEGRNDAVLRAVRSTLARGATKTEAVAVARGINVGFKDQLDNEELQTVVGQAFKYSDEETSKKTNSDDSDEENKIPWPQPLNKAAYQGLIGRFTSLVEPETEADPSAVLIGALAAFGSVIGRASYLQVGPVKHYLNIFNVTIGRTAKSRKGVALAEVARFFSGIDLAWEDDRTRPSVSTGEGIIHHLRDKIVKFKEDGTEDVVDPGISDKRLFIQGDELSATLQTMARAGNTLSSILRLSFDGKTLASTTKNNSEKATNPHVSILSNITGFELKQLMTEVDLHNGLANRFLFTAAKRSRELPFGGNVDLVRLDGLRAELMDSVDFGKTAGLITFSEPVKKVWSKIYHYLTAEIPGLVGVLAARTEPYTLRLAGIYAVADRSTEIKLPHLRAAVAIMDYSLATLYHFFGDSVGEPSAEKLLQATIEAENGLSKKEIYENVFYKNKSAEQIEGYLTTLEDAGLIGHRVEKTGTKNKTIYFKKHVKPVSTLLDNKKTYLQILDEFIKKLDLKEEATNNTDAVKKQSSGTYSAPQINVIPLRANVQNVQFDKAQGCRHCKPLTIKPAVCYFCKGEYPQAVSPKEQEVGNEQEPFPY